MWITVVKGCWESLVIMRSYWEQGLSGHRVQQLRSQWGTVKSGDESLGTIRGFWVWEPG